MVTDERSNANSSRDYSQLMGFTLIELLIVISVTAVLLAVLLPSLNRAKSLAKRAGCASNLKQLALAWVGYLDDNDGRFYQGIRANLDYGGWRGLKGWWPRPLNRHVGLLDPNTLTEENAKVFSCPADRGGIPGALLRERAYRVHGNSYQTNIFLIGQDRCGAFSETTKDLDLKISDRLPGLNHTDVSNPSRLLLIGDYGWINQWKPSPYPDKQWKKLAEWHDKADCYNMAFMDCHAQFLNIRKGFYVTGEYLVLPFADLHELAVEVQGPTQ